MRNTVIKTYNFIIFCGDTSFQVDINAYSEDEALDIISEAYPRDEDYRFMLL